MLIYVQMIAFVVIFYHFGENDYRSRGLLLGGASLLISLVTWFVLHWGSAGAIGGNLALYIGLLAYNMISERPPSSGSGF